jgi:dihydrofolate reductase
MKISIIVAISENNVIGKDNQLIWNLPKDLKLFKEKTMGRHMIMGRKTYESIGRPLPGRITIIITRNINYIADGCIVVTSVKDAIKTAEQAGETEVFIIGGSEIYKDTLNIADKIYLTEVNQSFEGDSFLEIDHSEWKEIHREKHYADEKHNYDFDFVELIK